MNTFDDLRVMETASGLKLNLGEPHVSGIWKGDIAHSLANVCRYAGHCSESYSVAEHSFLVAEFLRLTGCPARVQILGLLHDAHEAYLGDMTRPQKAVTVGRKELEARIQAVIYEAFRLPPASEAEEALIKRADNVALMTEAEELMPSRGEGWNIDAYPCDRLTVECLAHDEAEQLFLDRLDDLMRELAITEEP